MAKKKEHLIPFDKSKRVIYVNTRSKKQVCYPAILGMLILALLSFSYYASISVSGYGTSFYKVWAILSVVFVIIAFLMSKPHWFDWVPEWLKKVLLGGAIAGVIVFAITEAAIAMDFGAVAQPSADYVIVLGAQWKVSGPSNILYYRLETAANYLLENPETKVIVSGGQGSNEPIAEADGMKEWLVANGIEAERIFVENQSTNTVENFRYSSDFLDMTNDKVVVVTNNFHVFRAVALAKKVGYEQVDALAAPANKLYVANNLLREFFAVWKDILVGNIF